MKFDGRELGEAIVAQVRAFMARELKPWAERIDSLERREPIAGPAGLPGKNGAPGLDGRDGKDGKDAEPFNPESIRSMLAEMVANAVAEIPRPKDGEPGRDALQIDILPSIDASRSYPRGTFAQHAGGTLYAFRRTDPLTADIEKSGWSVCMNGVAEEREELSEDGRTYIRTTVYTSGAQMVREQKSQAIMDRGVYKSDVTYQKGDAVTWGGSSYIANCETSVKPDSIEGRTAWRLMAKRGRDGRDK